MLEVIELYKKFPNAPLPSVDRLTFSFPKGKISGLLGPNGAGKTTALSVICGLIHSFQGKLIFEGKEHNHYQSHINKQISLVPQQIALYPTLSCKENLLYFGKMNGIATDVLNKRIGEYLDLFSLAAHADKQIRHYSGGMKRRANLIASLLHQPTWLILDEPTAGVDVQSRKMILDFLKAYNRQGNTVIYTSHLLEEAESLCDEVLIIDHGKKIIHGKPTDLHLQYQTASLEELFLLLTGYQIRD